MVFRVLALAFISTLLGCEGASPRREVVVAFYDALQRGDPEGARRHIATSARSGSWSAAPQDSVSRSGNKSLEIEITRGALVRAEILKENQWAEHGIQYFVREGYADGSTRDVRIELLREGGTWRIAARVERP